MCVWTTFLRGILKNSPHLQITTIIYITFFNRKNFQTPFHPNYGSKSLRNNAHVYILCTPRFHICGVPTLQQKTLLISCTSNIFSHFHFHDPCSRRTNAIFLEAKYHYNIHFLLLLLLLILLIQNYTQCIKWTNRAVYVKLVTFNTTVYEIITYISYL